MSLKLMHVRCELWFVAVSVLVLTAIATPEDRTGKVRRGSLNSQTFHYIKFVVGAADDALAGQAVLPGHSVEPFTVDTADGSLTINPARSHRAAVVIVFNPMDPFQRVMWSSWSLQMFLRGAPLFAVDYLFVPYTSSRDAATDLSYYMYSQMLAAARVVYGTDETTDEDLRRRVFQHLHFVVTPGLAISLQVTRLIRQWQWRHDLQVLTVRPDTPARTATTEAALAPEATQPGIQDAAGAVTAAGAPGAATGAAAAPAGAVTAAAGAAGAHAAGALRLLAEAQDATLGAQDSVPEEGEGQDVNGGARGGDGKKASGRAPGRGSRLATGDDGAGLTVGRLDAWYGWLPSPAAASSNATPLVEFDDDDDDDDGLGGGGGGGRRSACDAVARKPSAVGRVRSSNRSNGGSGGGGGGVVGAWVLVPNTTFAFRPDCSYRDVILNLQRAGARGVIFWANPGQDVQVMAPPGELERAASGATRSPGRGRGPGWGGVPGPAAGGKPADAPGAATASASAGRSDSSQDTPRSESRGKAGRAGTGHDEEQEDREQEEPGEEEEEFPSIPATMVSYDDGLDLLTRIRAAREELNASCVVEFGTQAGPAAWFVADPWVGLAEAGWAQLPTMMHAGWAAWWSIYLGRLRERLRGRELEAAGQARQLGMRRAGEEEDKEEAEVGEEVWEEVVESEKVVDVFRAQPIFDPLSGISAATATVALPRAPARRFDRLLLDFALGCPAAFDASCPAWDHMVQLFACCDPQIDRCAACPTTLWQPEPHSSGARGSDSPARSAVASGGSGAGAKAGSAPAPAAQGDEAPERRCGLELGRWATPFRRRVGRWLTDVSSLMGVLGTGGRCTFTVQTVPWVDGNWTATLALRFRRDKRSAPDGIAAAPVREPTGGRQPAVESTSGDGRQYGSGLAADALPRTDTASGHWGRGGDDVGDRNRSDAGGDQPEALQARKLLVQQALAGLQLRGSHQDRLMEDHHADAVEGVQEVSPSPLVRAPRLRPISVVPLFSSAIFDSTYNRNRERIAVSTPRGARAAALVSYITGHGSDASGCGEFCPTSHHWFINGREIAVLNFTDAGTEWGCADAVLYGAVPNEHGTWFYGRGGWCDGAAVDPWVVDVSDALVPSHGPVTGGQADADEDVVVGGSGDGRARGIATESYNNTIWYKGMYGDQDPVDPPEGTAPGYIMMQSLLVFYA